jgi:hypothetical protein
MYAQQQFMIHNKKSKASADNIDGIDTLNINGQYCYQQAGLVTGSLERERGYGLFDLAVCDSSLKAALLRQATTIYYWRKRRRNQQYTVS